MNKKPILYLQTDARWKNKPYQVKGETATIGGSGCGPSCAAMLIETLTGKTFTPEDACNWSVKKGYKALNQGTYYSYFVPQFKEFGIDCQRINLTNIYGKPNHTDHQKVLELLKQGYYIIACMGVGLWTSSGHFVVMWWQDGKVRINDPASTKTERTSGDINTFRSQVKYYWCVDARNYNLEDDDMTEAQIRAIAHEEATKALNEQSESLANIKTDEKSWSWPYTQWAEKNGLISGDDQGRMRYKSFITREEIFTVLYRFFELLQKTFKLK